MSSVSDYERRLYPVLAGMIKGADLARQEGTTRQNISNQASRLKKKLKDVAKKNTEMQV